MTADWPAALASGWHPIALLDELGAGACISRTLLDTPLALFQGRGGPAILRDVCPHRNVPLSPGVVRDGELACPYHGWRFDGNGRCVHVPGSTSRPSAQARRYPAIVHGGLIWTSLAESPPPFRSLPDVLSESNRDGFWWNPGPSGARILDAVENLLDPAHPHFLHAGLVRSSGRRRTMQVTVTLTSSCAEAVYHEDAHPHAWIPRLLEGHRLRSRGRYIPPATGQLFFEGRRGVELAITVIFCPETPDRTRPFAHFSTRRGPLPAWLKRALLLSLHYPVVRQDRRMLSAQSRSIAHLGRADFTVGPLDFLGPAIWRLSRGETIPDETYHLSVEL